MKKQRPHYFVDGYNLIYVWEEIEIKDSLMTRDFLIRNLHDYGAYERFEITLVFDALKNKDEEILEVYDKFFRVIYSAYNETADNIIERLSYKEIKNKREVHVVSSDAAIETIILGAGAYRHPSREFYQQLKRSKQFLRKKYLSNVTLPLVRNEVANRVDSRILQKLENLRRQ